MLSQSCILKENSSPAMCIQIQLLALGLHFWGTYLKGVVNSCVWERDTMSDTSFSQLLLLGCVGVPLLRELRAAKPNLWHYSFPFMESILLMSLLKLLLKMHISLQKHLGTLEYSIFGSWISWKCSQVVLKREGKQETPRILEKENSTC